MKWIKVSERLPGDVSDLRQVRSGYPIVRRIDNKGVISEYFSLYGRVWGLENFEWLDETHEFKDMVEYISNIADLEIKLSSATKEIEGYQAEITRLKKDNGNLSKEIQDKKEECRGLYKAADIWLERYAKIKAESPYNLDSRVNEIKSGAELIAEKRAEQIQEPEWDLKLDFRYGNNQLIKVALFAINTDQFGWPPYWQRGLMIDIMNQDRVSQLKMAGAMIAAEIDRLQLKEKV